MTTPTPISDVLDVLHDLTSSPLLTGSPTISARPGYGGAATAGVPDGYGLIRIMQLSGTEAIDERRAALAFMRRNQGHDDVAEGLTVDAHVSSLWCRMALHDARVVVHVSWRVSNRDLGLVVSESRSTVAAPTDSTPPEIVALLEGAGA